MKGFPHPPLSVSLAHSGKDWSLDFCLVQPCYLRQGIGVIICKMGIISTLKGCWEDKLGPLCKLLGMYENEFVS